ncbi:MAG: D-2-hydroxyacid dehydrogenase [Pirellulaceae bacterium]|nr:D-2-hydroxyacid dehydrogenase [Pirellulaceae bacterium]
MKLVIHPPVDDYRLARIRQAAAGGVVVNARDTEQARQELPDADAFFGKMTPELLAVAGQLRWVQAPTASLEHYVFPELVEHPCVLTNMRGLFSDVIADHVFGYILCFARNLHLYIRRQIQRRWEPVGGESARSTFAAGPGQVSAMDLAHRHLSDCTVGIVGLGQIGREVARRARAFEMRVLAVDPVAWPAPDDVDALWDLAGLPRLLSESDFVVIAAPHTPSTAGMFGAEQFRQMRTSAYLINIGRGVIVRLDELTAALQAGQLAGAALDVFETEPLPEAHPLWAMENVIITPHVAACSPHIAGRHLDVLLNNIRRFRSGMPLWNVASKSEWF